jgi:ComF family protein
MRAWALAALDLVFPALCPVCEATLAAGRRDPLCGACWRAVRRLGAPACERCGVPLPAFEPTPGAPGLCGGCMHEPPAWDWARAAAEYEGVARDALHAFKFHGKRALARPLAALVVEQCAREVPPATDAVLAVPLPRARERERGFNQAALLAEHLGATLGIHTRPRWLVRTRATPPQSELSADARRANVRDAFTATPDVAGHDVVVIDDVLTTGSTVAACATALRQAGARRIGVLTVARVV